MSDSTLSIGTGWRKPPRTVPAELSAVGVPESTPSPEDASLYEHLAAQIDDPNLCQYAGCTDSNTMSNGYHNDIAPDEIEPLHSPNVPALYRGLVRSMKKDGWKGRPLLVIECANGSFVAWTGSHRIAAARETGLDSIPCYIIPELLIESDSIDARTGHVMDYERVKAINASGDETAIHLMWCENRFA